MAGMKKGTAKTAARPPATADSSPVDIRSLVGRYVHRGIGVLLVALAGYVDAISYIALGGFFASFMSGASVSLRVGLSEGDWGAVQAAAFVITSFLASAVVATITAGIVGIMNATTGAVWNAQANNSHYRITELVLPALTSAGLRRFESKTTLLPHMAGQFLIKSQDQERDTEVVAGRLIEFESGTESEILNMTDHELRFTMIEFK